MFNKNKWLKLSLLSLGIAMFFAPQAEATKVSSPNGTYQTGTYLYLGPGAGYVYAGFGKGAYIGDSPANSMSTAVTEGQVLASVTQTTMGLITARTAEVQHGDTSAYVGASSGNSAHRKVGVWIRGGYNNIKQDTANLKWRADVYSVAVGADYKLHPTVLAGLAFLYSNVNGDTDFNKGSINDNSYGFSPYVNWKPVKWFALDVMGGYNWVNKNRDRTLLDTNGQFTGAKVTGKPKSKRWFVGGFGNFMHSINRANLLARVGVTHMVDKQDAVTESNGDRYTSLDTKLTTLNTRLQAGYKATKQLEPYAFFTYDYDLSRSKVNNLELAVANGNTAGYVSPDKARSRNTFGGGAGLKMDITSCVTGGLEYSYSQNKKLKNHGITANLRYNF